MYIYILWGIDIFEISGYRLNTKNTRNPHHDVASARSVSVVAIFTGYVLTQIKRRTEM